MNVRNCSVSKTIETWTLTSSYYSQVPRKKKKLKVTQLTLSIVTQVFDDLKKDIPKYVSFPKLLKYLGMYLGQMKFW